LGKVIKGRKYILAGNFPPEHKQTFIDTLTKELGINIVAVVTSDNTHFIEYDEEDNELNNLDRENDKLIKENVKIDELKYRNAQLIDALKKKKGWFK